MESLALTVNRDLLVENGHISSKTMTLDANLAVTNGQLSIEDKTVLRGNLSLTGFSGKNTLGEIELNTAILTLSGNGTDPDTILTVSGNVVGTYEVSGEINLTNVMLQGDVALTNDILSVSNSAVLAGGSVTMQGGELNIEGTNRFGQLILASSVKSGLETGGVTINGSGNSSILEASTTSIISGTQTIDCNVTLKTDLTLQNGAILDLAGKIAASDEYGADIRGNLTVQNGVVTLKSGSSVQGNLELQAGTVNMYDSSVGQTVVFSGNLGVNRELNVYGDATVSSMNVVSDALVNIAENHSLVVSGAIGPAAEGSVPGALTKFGKGAMIVEGGGSMGSLLVADGTFETQTTGGSSGVLFKGSVTADGENSLIQLSDSEVQGTLAAQNSGKIVMNGGTFNNGLQLMSLGSAELNNVNLDNSKPTESIAVAKGSILTLNNSKINYVGSFTTSGILNMKSTELWARNGDIKLLGEENVSHIEDSTLQASSLMVGHIATHVYMTDSVFAISGTSEVRGNLHLFATENDIDLGSMGDIVIYNGANMTVGVDYGLDEEMHYSTGTFILRGNVTLADNADANTFEMKNGVLTGKVLVEGSSNIFSMTDATIDGSLTVEGGTLTFDGQQNTVTGKATLGADSEIHAGTIFTAQETHLSDNLLTIEGSLNSELYLEGGNALLKGDVASLEKDINIASGTFTYQGTGKSMPAGRLTNITFTSYLSSDRNLDIHENWAIGNLALNASGQINLGEENISSSPVLNVKGVLSGSSNLTVTGTGDVHLEKSGTHTGDIHYEALGELHLDTDYAIGTVGTLYIGSYGTTTDDVHAFVTGVQSKNVVATHIKLTTEGDATWAGTIYQDSLTKDGQFDLTIANRSSTIGSLTVEEGNLFSQGSNRFVDLIARNKAGAALSASITLNQGDTVNGNLETGTGATINLNGLTTNIKKVANEGTLNLSDGSNILVGESFVSSGEVSLNNATLRITDTVSVTGNGSIHASELNKSSSFQTSSLMISGGGLDFSNGINTVNVNEDMTVSGGSSMVQGVLLVGNTLGMTGDGKLTLQPVGDTSSYLGDVSMSGKSVFTVGNTVNPSTQTVRAESVSIEENASLVLNNINLNINGGLGNLTMTGNSDADQPSSLVTFNNVRLEGNIAVSAANAVELSNSVYVTGNLDFLDASSSLTLSGQGDISFQGQVELGAGHKLVVQSPTGLKAAGLNMTAGAEAAVYGSIGISGISGLSGAVLTLEDRLTGTSVQNFGSLGTLTLSEGSTMTASGRDIAHKALLAGNMTLDDNSYTSASNTLLLKNLILDGNVSMSGESALNTLSMEDTTLLGDLTLYGGTFNSKGSNSVKTATIGGKTVVRILDGALTADNIRLVDDASMTISSQLDSGLILDGTGVVVTMDSPDYMGDTMPSPGFALTGNLTVNAGEFVYKAGAVAGRITMNGAVADEARISVVNDCSTSINNILSMSNFGTISVVGGKTLTMNGSVINKGTLRLIGEGNFEFTASGTHAGEVEYNGTGVLTLSGENALGNSGRLTLTQADGLPGHIGTARLDVRANQGKDLMSEYTRVEMTAFTVGNDPVVWSGIMNLTELTLSNVGDKRSNMTLASSNSFIGTLRLNKSTFKSNGSNKFGNIDLSDSGELYLSAGDEINGVMTSDSSTITLDGVTAHNILGLTNKGTLNLINSTSITVAGDMESSGILNMDSSSLAVNRLTTLGTTSLKDSVLSGKMSVEVKGTVATTSDNVESQLVAGILNVSAGGQLLFEENSGLANVTVTGDFMMAEDSRDSVITGNLNVGGKLLMNGGNLDLHLAGEKSSSIGTVSIQKGNLSISAPGSDGPRNVSASAITVDHEDSYLDLTNVNLNLNEGNGTLLLNGGTDPQKSYEQLRLNNSLVTGNVTILDRNSAQVSSSAAITGTMTVNGNLEVNGSGTLTLGNLAIVGVDADAAAMAWDGGELLVNGETSLSYGSLSLTSEKDSLGRLGAVAMSDGSSLTLQGKSADAASRSNLGGSITLERSGGNTLAFSHVKLAGNVTVENAGKDNPNQFTMEDSDIAGKLTMNGGIFNVTGTMNTATEASISGDTQMTVLDGSIFKSLTTTVNADAVLNIYGTMEGSVRISGGSVNMGNDRDAGTLTGDLMISEGIFHYVRGSVGGSLVLSGTSGNSPAQMNVEGIWNADNHLEMLGYGQISIEKEGAFNLAGDLSGNGVLTVTGEGTMSLGASGTHETDIRYSAGMLTLTSTNALGSKGTLAFQNSDASMTIGRQSVSGTIEQSKNMTGDILNVVTLQDSAWLGTVSLGTFNKSGDKSFTLAGNGSSLGNVHVSGGSLISNGANILTNLDAENGSIVVNTGGSVNGTVTTATDGEIFLNGVVSSIVSLVKSIDNAGALTLSGKTALIVSGSGDDAASLVSTGTLTVKDSSLTVENGGENDASLAETFLGNATIALEGNLKVQGTVASSVGNTTSLLQAADLTISGAGALNLKEGVNNVSLSGQFIQEAGESHVYGSIVSSSGMFIDLGTTLNLRAIGPVESDLGDVFVNGVLSIGTNGSSMRKVSAAIMEIYDSGESDEGGRLDLSNINLEMDGGEGTLLLVNDSDDMRELAHFSGFSMLTGSLGVSGGNQLYIDDSFSVTGDMMVSYGGLDLTGGGTLSVKGNTLLSDDAFILVDKRTTFATGSLDMDADTELTVYGRLGVSGDMTVASSQVVLETSEAGHDFGSVGNTLVLEGSGLSATGLSSADKALLAGKLTISGGSTLTLTNILHTGDITITDDEGSRFDMTDSSIFGMLDVAGGTMTLTGTNYAREASVSNNAFVSVNNGASLQVDTTVVKPTGHLDVLGTLHGALLLEGGSATVSAGGTITNWVKVSSGELLLNGTNENPLANGLIFNGTEADGSAHVIVDRKWEMGSSLTMSGFGTLSLNNDMVLNGALIGAGRLDIDGSGTMSFNNQAESVFSGDIYYSAGDLVLGHKNAVGTSGLLSLSGDNVNMSVKDDQGKNLAGTNVTMMTDGSVTWGGQVILDSLTVKGDGLTLAARQSDIGNLQLVDTTFVSKGSNSFGGVTVGANSDAAFNLGDSLTGLLDVASTASATFNNVEGTLQRVSNAGTVTIGSNSGLVVSGNFDSTGDLVLSGNSSLQVNGDINLARTTLTDGRLTANGKLTISDEFLVGAGNKTSSITASSLEIANDGSLMMQEGINSIAVSGNFTMSGGKAEILGYMTVGGDTILNAGTLTLSSTASTLSSLGAILAQGGDLNLIGNGTHRMVNALSVSVSNGSQVVLDNTELKLSMGDGTLTLNNGSLSFVDNSVLGGHLLANGDDIAVTFDDKATIQGNLQVTGDSKLSMTGQGAQSLVMVGANLQVDAGSAANINKLNLTVNGSATVAGSLTLAAEGMEGFNFGRINKLEVVDGGSFSLIGADGVQSYFKSDIALTSPNSTAADDGSDVILGNVILEGNISVSADYNHLTLTNTTVQKNVTLAGTNNVFDMTGSSINGMLDISGGTLNLSGTNYAKSAAISGNDTVVNVGEKAVLEVDTTVVKPKGHLNVAGILNGALLLDGGSATLTGMDALISKDVTVTSGSLELTGTKLNSPIGGNLYLNGSSVSSAKVTLNSAWVFDHNIVMDGNGSLILNDSLVLNGILTGSGQLNVSGTGGLSLMTAASDSADQYQGDIYYSSTGDLTLGASNVIGSTGLLSLSVKDLNMFVTGDQGKNLIGRNVHMTTADSLTWSGQVSLDKLELSGEGLTLGARSSNIGTLIANEGDFLSLGSNTFGNVTLTGTSSANFTQGDRITGVLDIDSEASAVFNYVESSLQTITNAGSLTIGPNSLITVSTSFTSTGDLLLKDTSTLTVNGQLAMSRATLHNSRLQANGKLTISGDVKVADDNENSSIAADSLEITTGGSLAMNTGLNTVNVAGNLLMSDGTADISGVLTVGGNTLLTSGSLNLTSTSSTISSLGSIVAQGGRLNLIGSETHRIVNALSATIGNGSTIALDNTELLLSSGNGTLTLNNGTLSFANDSVLGGNLLAQGEDMFVTFTDTATIRGNVRIAGNSTLELSGTGTGSMMTLGSNMMVEQGSASIVNNLALNVNGTVTVNGSMELKTDVAGGFDFGRINQIDVANGGSFSFDGADGTQSRLKADIALSSPDSVSQDDGSILSLKNMTLDGSISVSADYNRLTLINSEVSKNVTLAGTTNVFDMTDSRVMGLLDIAGGTLNLDGTNYAKSASISGDSTTVNIGTNATLAVDTLVVKPKGHLGVAGILDGALLLDGGSATLTGANAQVSKDVTITSGILTLDASVGDTPLGGDLHFNGAQVSSAKASINNAWVFGGDVVMDGNGTLTLGNAMTMNGILTGKGQLNVTGTGALTLNKAADSSVDQFSGDMIYGSTGDLTLGASNVLGTSGLLTLSASGVNMFVTGNQSKSMSGHDVVMTVRDGAISWNGQMTLDSLTVSGDGLTLAARQSNIGSLVLNGGNFDSKGSNSFGNVTVNADNASFYHGDSISGTLTIAQLATTVFDQVESTLQQIQNEGNLTIGGNSAIIVTKSFDSTGDLLLTGNSALTVNGKVSLTQTTLENSSLTANGLMTVSGKVQVSADNTASSIVASSLDIAPSGSLMLDTGINSVKVAGNFLMSGGTASITGLLTVGSDTVLNGGTLTLTAASSTISSLGTVMAQGGDLNLVGVAGTQRLMNALSVDISKGSHVTLDNAELKLSQGDGTLNLKNGRLSFTNNSILGGNLLANGQDIALDFTDTAAIQGNVKIAGDSTLSLTGQGVGSLVTIQGSVVVEQGSSSLIDKLSLDVGGTTTVSGTMNLGAAGLAGFDFGRMNHVDVIDGGSFKLVGADGTASRLKADFALSSPNSTALNNGSTLELGNMILDGSISVSADYNHLILTDTTVQKNVTLAGTTNVFDMTDSSINGLLDISGGTLNLNGRNYAKSAAISGNDTEVNIGKDAVLEVDTTVVKPKGQLNVEGLLDGALLLDGGSATLTGMNALVSKDVTITSGLLTLTDTKTNSPIGGDLHFNGTSVSAAKAAVNSIWAFDNDVVMDGNGSLMLNESMTLNGILTGKGQLNISGSGSLTLATAAALKDQFTGNIDYSAGDLILGASDVLGTIGSLNLASSSTVNMFVTGTHSKELLGNSVAMTTNDNVDWKGHINLTSLTVEGSGLSIDNRNSSIDSLTVNSGGFASAGGNTFGEVTAKANAIFNAGDKLTSSLAVFGTATQVDLNNVTASLKSVTNEGTLNLKDYSAVNVSGTMNSTGTLNVIDSSLNVAGGNLTLVQANLINGDITVAQELVLTGTVQVSDLPGNANVASSVSVGSLQVEGGHLILDKGINALNATDTFTLSQGTVTVRGSMGIGTSTTVSGGTLSLIIAGNTVSSLGKAVVNGGTVNLTGSDLDHRAVSAGSLTMNNSAEVNLDNVFLSLDSGNGVLSLNGGTLNFRNGSVLHGNMAVNGSNSLSFEDTAQITGNVDVVGTKGAPTELVVTGGIGSSLKIGGDVKISSDSDMIVDDLLLDIQGRTTVSGHLTVQVNDLARGTVGVASDSFINIGTVEIRDNGHVDLLGSHLGSLTLEDGSTFTGSGFKGSITMVNQGVGVSNSLNMDHVYLLGDVTMAKGGDDNSFLMTDSHIEGDLIMEAGDLTLTGTNFAKNAYISSKADLIGDTDSFEVKNTIVKEDGHLTIGGDSGTSTLNGILWLADGGQATLNLGGVIKKDVTIENGSLHYFGGKVEGNLNMNGDTRGVARIDLGTHWNNGDELSVHSINMKSYGAIALAGMNMRVNGGQEAGDPILKGIGLAGSGILEVSGGGTLSLDASGTHTGDIDVSSSSLVLNAVNALGTRGTLNAKNVMMIVNEDQDKNIAGSDLTMVTSGTKTVNWNGAITLDHLLVDGDLNLASSGSVIDFLELSSGAFASTGKGVNTFGDILAHAGSSAVFNKTDQVGGKVQTEAVTGDSSSLIVFDGTHTNVASIDNAGELVLKNNADISVTGNVDDTGRIVMNNSNLAASGNMTVTEVTTEGAGSSNIAADNLTVSGSLTMESGTNHVDVKTEMNVDGDATVNGSMTVGGQLNVNQGGSLDLSLSDSTSNLGDVSVSGDLAISGGETQKKTVHADSMTVNGGGSAELNNVNLNLTGNGSLVLEGLSDDEIASLEMNSSTVIGNVITKGDYTDLTMSNSSIIGNLEVNGGWFTIDGRNQVSGNATIQENAHVVVKKDSSLESGVISLAPDGDLTVNEGGSLGNSSISFGGEDSDEFGGNRTVSFEGDNQKLSGNVIVNADGTIQAGTVDSDDGSVTEGTLTISGALVGTDHTLHLVTNGDNSSIKINSSNDGFSSDVDLSGHLILSANNALGKGGVLIVGEDSTVTTDNGRNGFGSLEIGKNISGTVLNLETLNNTTLSGDLENLGSLNKTGSKELLLNGGGTIIGSFNVMDGSAVVDGAHTVYEVGNINVASDTSMKFIGESTVKGNSEDSLLTSSGTVFIKNATVELDVLVNDGSLTLDDNAEVLGDMILNNGELNLSGTGLKLDEGGRIILQSSDTIEEASRTMNVKQDLTLGGALVVNADGVLNVSTNRNLYLAGSLEGNAELALQGRGKVTIQNSSDQFSGTLSVGDYSTLVGETSGAFGNASSTLKISGERAVVTTGKDGAVDSVSFEGKLDSNGKNFEMKTWNDTYWNGVLAGTGTMNKTGDGRLVLDKRTSDDITDTMDINVKTGELILDRMVSGDITLSGGTTLSGHSGTTGAVIANAYSSKDAVIEVGSVNNKGEITTLNMGSLTMGSSSRYVVDIDILGSKSDMISVSGTATLNNATVELRQDFYTLEQEKVVADKSRWTILESGDLVGSFSGKVDHDLYYYNVEVEQVDNHVDLVLHLNYKGQNIYNINNEIVNNVTNITNVLEHIEALNPDGEMGKVIENLKDVNGEDNIKNALESIGGLCLTPLMQTQIDRNNNHMRIMRSAVDNTSWKMATKNPNIQVWAQATGDHSELHGDGNGSGYKRDAWGGTVGVERAFQMYKLQAGMAFSYDSEDWTAMGNKNRNNTSYLDFYVRKDTKQWHHYGLVGLSQTDIGADRTVAFGNYYNKALGDTSAFATYASYEAAYDARVRQDSVFQLIGQVQIGYHTIDGYTEHGPIGNAGLNIEGQNALSVELGVGGRYYESFSSIFDDAPAARVGFKALFTYDAADQGAPTHASFIADPSTSYFMKPARESRYGGLFGIDLTMPYDQNVSFYMGGTFEVKSSANNITGNIGVVYTF